MTSWPPFRRREHPEGYLGSIDARFFANYADTPVFCFDPGAYNIHAMDEYLPIADLERAAVAYALLAMEWCGYEVIE